MSVGEEGWAAVYIKEIEYLRPNQQNQLLENIYGSVGPIEMLYCIEADTRWDNPETEAFVSRKWGPTYRLLALLP